MCFDISRIFIENCNNVNVDNKSYDHSSDFLLIFTSSTSNTKTEFPGIFGGDPLAPYPMSGGITSLRFSPSHIL